MKTTCRAMSMMEVMIALVIFSVVLVAVMQSMISTTSYVEFDATRSDLQTESLQFQNHVIHDLANAAWFFRYDPVTDQSYIDPATKSRVPLYPYVSDDRASIEFIKLRTSLKVADSPAEERYSFTNFRTSATRPVDFTSYVDATPTALMVMNPNYIADPQWFVASVWESNQEGLSFDDNQDPRYLRHYLYAVETAADGSRNLVRKYLNGYDGVTPPIDQWVLDEVLLRNVTEVAFATRIEDNTVNENQIRISVEIERAPQGGAITGATVKRRIEFSVAMRSINQEN